MMVVVVVVVVGTDIIVYTISIRKTNWQTKKNERDAVLFED